ncbi:MAG: AAA family ATPase, partial [Alicyclobacillaceae bacterium]|nr:AAA family ATPase [Alicyclobacillaceae bacterium]
MRITWWRVGKFGRWRGIESGTVSPGLTVFYGPNEAGKTTWLHFVRAMLFGETHRERSPYWSPEIGWSGALGVRLGDGEEWVIERYTEGRRAEVRILLPDGSRAGEEDWQRRLGGLSRFVYDQIFAFGLGELERFESLADNRIASQLYSVGAGLRGVDLAAVEQSFQRRMEDRYKARGRKPVINQLLSEWRECERHIRALGDPGAEYGRVTADLAACDGEEAALAGRRAEIRERRQELLRWKQIREIWETWANTESEWRELQELPDVDPEEVARLDRLAERAAELRAREEWERRELESLRQEWAALGEPGPLWPERERVRLALHGQAREGWRREEKARLHSEREALAAGEREVWRRLGPEVGKDGDGPDTSLGARDFGSRLWREVERAEEDRRRAQVALDQQRRAVEQVRDERERLSGQVEEADGGGAADRGGMTYVSDPVGERRARLRALQAVRQRRVEAEARLEALMWTANLSRKEKAVARRRLSGWVAVMLAVVGMAAAGIAAGASAWVLLPLAVLGTIAAAVPLWSKRKGRGAETGDAGWERQRRELEEQVRALEEEERGLARGLFGRDEWSERDVEFIERSLDEEARLQVLALERHKRLEELRQREESAFRLLEAEERKVAGAVERLNEARRAWQRWLAEQGLPLHWEWPQVSAAMDGFDRLQELRGRREDVERRLRQLEEESRTWRAELKALCLLGGMAVPPDWPEGGEWETSACRWLQRAWEEEEQRAARRDRVGEALREAERRWAETAQRLRRVEEDLQQGWAALGVSGEEQWRNLRPRLLRRRERREQRRTLEEQMRRLCGGELPLSDVEKWDFPRIEAVLEDLDRDEEEVDRRMKELVARRSALVARRKELEEGQSLAHWIQRREEIAERLRREVEEWAVNALALHLLRRTKERYERVRQPAVIRRASTLFAALTGGRYSRIVVPLGEETWYAEDGDGKRWPLDQLSRGTAEQLYLAIRLGLIEDLRQRGLVPPVIMDDVLVNFDPVRRRRAVALLAELARERQLFYLTCHPEVVEEFRRASEEVVVVELSSLE